MSDVTVDIVPPVADEDGLVSSSPVLMMTAPNKKARPFYKYDLVLFSGLPKIFGEIEKTNLAECGNTYGHMKAHAGCKGVRLGHID